MKALPLIIPYSLVLIKLLKQTKYSLAFYVVQLFLSGVL